jgi:virginiamycin B lyase
LAAGTNVLIQEWSVPTPRAGPHDPALGPDGALWYTGQTANLLGRLDPVTGEIREYPLPTPGSGPHGLIADKDGNIWFTGNARGYIGKLDPATGRVTEYPMPDPRARDPHTPIFDQRGILWFTVQQGNFVGRLDPRTGEVTLRTSPTPNSLPYGIVINAQGIPFYSEFGINKIASINPATMDITEYALPVSGTRPRRLTITPDGMVYYTDFSRGYLGRLDPATGRVDEWRSPAGASAQPYGIASTADGAVWYSEAGTLPNTLVRFDPSTQSFEKWLIPSGGGVVRHIVTTPGGQVYIACSGVNQVGIAFVFANQNRFTVPDRGVLSRITPGAANTMGTAGYARIAPDTSAAPPSGFAVISLRQGGVLVSEATVGAAAPIRNGRIFAAIDGPLKTALALANANSRAASVSFYFTDAAGRDFNSGSITIPANEMIARFLDEPPFNVQSLTNATLTFSSDIAIGAIELRGYANERSEFLMTTLPVVEPAARPSSSLIFPQFAVGGGWSTDILLLNPGENTLTGSVSLRSSGMPFSNFDYTIPPKSARAFNVSAGNSMGGEPTRIGLVRVVPAAGSEAPEGSLVMTLKNGPMTVSTIGMGAARAASQLHVYAYSSQSVQTGIAVANPSNIAAVVNVDLIAASGEPAGATTITVPSDGQVTLFLNEINGLPAIRNFEGMLRLSTTSPAGIAVTGLRGRYNERGDFLVTATPPAEELSTAADLFPFIIDGGGYSTQFVLFRAASAQAPAGSLQFYTQSGQPLELSVR